MGSATITTYTVAQTLQHVSYEFIWTRIAHLTINLVECSLLRAV